MIQIGQLLKYIANLNPQLSPARLAFYNYLNHFCRSEHVMTADVFNNFFSAALEYPHWQQAKAQLGEEILKLIEGVGVADSFSLDEIHWPQELQIVELANFKDFSETVHNFLNVEYMRGEKFRLVSDQQKKLMAVVLFPEGQVRIRTFDRKMKIRNGSLQPLRQDLSIAYNSQLELSSAIPHKLELAPYTCAQFELIDGEIVGSAVRGYLFQKFEDYRGGDLRTYPKLFYSIKKVEQYYIDRRTDTFYNEIVEAIEKNSNLLKLGSPLAFTETPLVLQQAEAALEQVFVGDKLLGLLVRDFQQLWHNHRPKNPPSNPLKNHPNSSSAVPERFDSINSSLTAESPAVGPRIV